MIAGIIGYIMEINIFQIPYFDHFLNFLFFLIIKTSHRLYDNQDAIFDLGLTLFIIAGLAFSAKNIQKQHQS